MIDSRIQSATHLILVFGGRCEGKYNILAAAGHLRGKCCNSATVELCAWRPTGVTYCRFQSSHFREFVVLASQCSRTLSSVRIAHAGTAFQAGTIECRFGMAAPSLIVFLLISTKPAMECSGFRRELVGRRMKHADRRRVFGFAGAGRLVSIRCSSRVRVNRTKSSPEENDSPEASARPAKSRIGRS